MIRCIQNWYIRHKEKWWFKVSTYLVCLIIGFLIKGSLDRFLNPSEKPRIRITYDWIQAQPFEQAGTKENSKSTIRIDYREDQPISAVHFDLINVGLKEDSNFEINFSVLNKKIEIIKSYINFEPSILERKVLASEDSKKLFYRKMKAFPCKAEISFEVFLSASFRAEDIKFEFMSDFSTWIPKHGKIKLRSRDKAYLRFDQKNFSFAFAEEPVEQILTIKSNSSSKILMGGYDPSVLTNRLFEILQEKKILKTSEAQKIKEIVEQGKDGFLFGNVNFLKFNEMILNVLIKNKIISVSEANLIIEKSKKSGGLLINGYNIIVLEVEILNKLIQKGYLDIVEGQMAVNNAKFIPSNR